jgi:hypothetical protein
MGGIGSGRPNGSGRSTVESCRSIDVSRLYQEDCLAPGWTGISQWIRDGEEVASIAMAMGSKRLVLIYQFRSRSGHSEKITEFVPIVRASCRFGGTRPYFLCPGVVISSH